jgi:hypothetical protein
MLILNSLAQAAVKPFSQSIDQRTHAILDYANVGVFLLAGGIFWKRSKRAAAGALVAATAALTINLLTDYPGGVKKRITFNRHREIDFGLAALAATMPEFLTFKEDPEHKFFLAEGALISALTNLSKGGKSRRAERKSPKAA